MKKAVLFSALLTIITLLSSCNNSERYHFSHSSKGLMFLSDSKTGKVYFTVIGMKYMETWDPIKKTLTMDSLKIEYQDLASNNHTPQKQGSPQISQTQLLQLLSHYTIQQLGAAAKAKYPDKYGNMSDSVAGEQLINEYPVYKQYLRSASNNQQQHPFYTIEQIGASAKLKFPKQYGSLSDSAAGMEAIRNNPELKQYLKKEIRRKK